jgi:hypothetical protein
MKLDEFVALFSYIWITKAWIGNLKKARGNVDPLAGRGYRPACEAQSRNSAHARWYTDPRRSRDS